MKNSFNLLLILTIALLLVSCKFSDESNERGERIFVEPFQIGAQFGMSVAISEDKKILVTGAPGASVDGEDLYAGTLHIFSNDNNDGFIHKQMLYKSQLDDVDNFGELIALSDNGNILAASTPLKDDGLVVTFKNDNGGWAEYQTIYPPQQMKGSGFGKSIALSSNGNILVVGASMSGADHYKEANYLAGCAYVYLDNGTQWELLSTLENQSSKSEDRYGKSVAISGDGKTIIVCSENADEYAGAAQVYCSDDLRNWSFKTKLSPQINKPFSRFGSSVSINEDGSKIFLPAYTSHIYEKSDSNWVLLQTIAPPDSFQGIVGWDGDFSANGKYVIISAIPSFGVEPTYSSKVFAPEVSDGVIFLYSISETGQYILKGKYQSSTASFNSGFGHACDISSDGKTIIVGAYMDTYKTDVSGSVYIFDNDSL